MENLSKNHTLCCPLNDSGISQISLSDYVPEKKYTPCCPLNNSGISQISLKDYGKEKKKGGNELINAELNINDINSEKISLVSVILPTLNRLEGFKKAVLQILNQTHQNFELIIIDDGSEKNILLEKEEFINNTNNPKIKFLKNSSNRKIPYTINKGINNSSGDYITWVSDDNEYYSNFIKTLLIKNTYFTYSRFNFKNHEMNVTKLIGYEYTNVNDLIKSWQGLGSFMYSRELLNKIGNYDENLFGAEDYEYLLRIYNNIDSNKIKYIPVSTMLYNMHRGSGYSMQFKRIRKLTDNINLIYTIINKNKDSQVFLYYSKTRWSQLFQRPHQIIRFMNKDYLKIFITSDDICEYEESNNLLIINYKFKNIIFNNYKDIIIYFTDTRLYHEIENLPGKKLFDLIDAPINEFEVWRPNLEVSVKNSDYVMYSHPDLVTYLNEIDNKKKYHYISNACDYEHKKVSIVMAYYNRKPQTLETLKGFQKMYAGKYNFEVVIVDDNSNEKNRLEEDIKQFNFPINLIVISKEEKGDRINPCTVYNRGFAEAKGTIIVFINDCIINNNYPILSELYNIDKKYVILNSSIDKVTTKNFKNHYITCISKKDYKKIINLQNNYTFNPIETFYLIKNLLNYKIEYINNFINDEINYTSEYFLTNEIMPKTYNNIVYTEYIKGLITVILPTYNRPTKCLETIKMMINQKYSNFELFIYNDGSIEDYTVVTDYLSTIQDNRIKYYTQHNQKLPSTLNSGLKIANGEYITWISDDNTYYENFLEILYDDKYDYIHSAWEFKILYNGKLVKNEGSQKVFYNNYKNIEELLAKKGVYPGVSYYGVWSGLASFMWRTNFLKSIYGWEDGYHGIEDYDILFKTFLHTRSIKYVNEYGMCYNDWKENNSNGNIDQNGLTGEVGLLDNNNKLYTEIVNKYYYPIYKLKTTQTINIWPDSIDKIAFTFWHGDQFTYLHYLSIETIALYNPDFKIIIYTIDKTTEHKWCTGELSEKIQCNSWFTRIERLKKHYKNVEFIALTNENLDYTLYPANIISDLVRWKKIYEHGGVWFDTDIIFRKSLNYLFTNILKNCDLNKLDFVISNYTNVNGIKGYTSWWPCGILMGKKRSKTITSFLEKLESAYDKNDYNSVGPNLAKKMFVNVETFLKKYENVGIIDDLLIYPFNWNQINKYFSPNIINKNTVCLHWYNGGVDSRKYLNYMSSLIDNNKYFICKKTNLLEDQIIHFNNKKTYTHGIFNICCVIDSYGWALDIGAQNIKEVMEKNNHNVFIYTTDELRESILNSSFNIYSIHLFVLLNSFDIQSFVNLKPTLISLLPKNKIVQWICDYCVWINNPNKETLENGKKMMYDTIENSSITLIQSKRIKNILKTINKDKNTILDFPYLCNLTKFNKIEYDENILHKKKLVIGWAGNASPYCHGWLKGLDSIKKVINNNNDKFELIYHNKFEGNGINYSKMPTFYKNIDIYICFSTYEGGPNTIFEASACGKAWISTNVGNIPEMLEYDSNCGIMIEKEPIDNGEKLLEENLIRLYNNREKIIEMGDKARNVVEEHFNYINIVNNTFNTIFDELLPI